MTTSATRSFFTKQYQTCKTKTKTDFFWSQNGLVLRPTVSDSDHITGPYVTVTLMTFDKQSNGRRVEVEPWL